MFGARPARKHRPVCAYRNGVGTGREIDMVRVDDAATTATAGCGAIAARAAAADHEDVNIAVINSREGRGRTGVVKDMDTVEAIGQDCSTRSTERRGESRERSGLLGRSAVRACRVDGIAVFGLGVEAADCLAECDIEIALADDFDQVDGRRIGWRGGLPVAHLHQGGRFACAKCANRAGHGHERPALRDGRRRPQERRVRCPDQIANSDDAAAAPTGGVVPESATTTAAESVFAVFSDGIAANAAAAAAAESTRCADITISRRQVRIATATARKILREAENVGRQAVAADSGMEAERRRADIRAQRPARRTRAASAAGTAITR